MIVVLDTPKPHSNYFRPLPDTRWQLCRLRGLTHGSLRCACGDAWNLDPDLLELRVEFVLGLFSGLWICDFRLSIDLGLVLGLCRFETFGRMVLESGSVLLSMLRSAIDGFWLLAHDTFGVWGR